MSWLEPPAGFPRRLDTLKVPCLLTLFEILLPFLQLSAGIDCILHGVVRNLRQPPVGDCVTQLRFDFCSNVAQKRRSTIPERGSVCVRVSLRIYTNDYMSLGVPFRTVIQLCFLYGLLQQTQQHSRRIALLIYVVLFIYRLMTVWSRPTRMRSRRRAGSSSGTQIAVTVISAIFFISRYFNHLCRGAPPSFFRFAARHGSPVCREQETTHHHHHH